MTGFHQFFLFSKFGESEYFIVSISPYQFQNSTVSSLLKFMCKMYTVFQIFLDSIQCYIADCLKTELLKYRSSKCQIKISL